MTNGFRTGHALRPTAKLLPEDARGHNRSLVLQTLLHQDGLSRADIARETGLTRVTISDLVSELLSAGLVREVGQREDARPGKPATLLEFNTDASHVIGLDLSDHTTFRGAVMRLDGSVVARSETALAGRKGAEAVALVEALISELVASTDRPLLGIGIGSPGVVDLAGTVLSAPNLAWHDLPLQRDLEARYGVPVVVANDANAAALAEHSFGGASGDMMLIAIGHGVEGGLVLGGRSLFGSRYAAGEIGHVTVGTDGGPTCACGKQGCLEAWLSAPRLEEALALAEDDEARTAVLVAAGTRLGIALAPVVGALDLSEVVLTGPRHLVDGDLAEAALRTLRMRTLPQFHDHVELRRSTLGDDIVLRGAAAGVVSARLGVS